MRITSALVFASLLIMAAYSQASTSANVAYATPVPGPTPAPSPYYGNSYDYPNQRGHGSQKNGPSDAEV